MSLEERIARIRASGPQSLYILSDFDRTLTKTRVNGKEVSSLISILRNENYLTPDYSAKAHALYETYHPLEIDPTVSIERKKQAAQEWWDRHFELLVASRLNKKDIARAVASHNFQLRDGYQKFFSLCHAHNIPVIIMSSSGLGVEGIRANLRHNKITYDTVHIISNEFEWDAEGYAVAAKKPGINGMNKNGTFIMQSPIYSQIQNKKNVILLGDGESDLMMANNLPYKNLLSICFLDSTDQPNANALHAAFDTVVPNDGPMDYVVNLLQTVIA